jgi:hypothetical protein
MNRNLFVSITEVHNGTPFGMWDVTPKMANKLVSIPMHFHAHLAVSRNWIRVFFPFPFFGGGRGDILH